MEKITYNTLVRKFDVEQMRQHFRSFGMDVKFDKIPQHIYAPNSRVMIITGYARELMRASQTIKGFGSWGLNDTFHLNCAGVIKKLRRTFKNGITLNKRECHSMSELKDVFYASPLVNWKRFKKTLLSKIIKYEHSFQLTYPGGGSTGRIYCHIHNKV